MPYFESTLQHNDTAEIINLKRILELCNLPDVGLSPLDPQLNSDTRCMNALTTLEKTTGVFDDGFYQDAVFVEELDEDIVDAELYEAAKSKGVPEDHFPAKCIRSPPVCPIAPNLQSVLVAATHIKALSSVDTPSINIISESPQTALPTPPAVSRSNRPSISLSIPFRKSSRSLSSSPSRPSSPSSFFSTFSRSSSTSAQPPRLRTRESLLNLFRRDYRSFQRPGPVDETRAWSPTPRDSDIPSLQSARTDSQVSSSPSISVSSRTSTSSFAELSLYSFANGRILQKCTKTAKFVLLRSHCVNEAKRFIDFAQHQRVALPLFLGRTRLYLDGRMKIRLTQLHKKHEIAVEELADKHIEQEIFETDNHADQQKEKATKTATALKHMNKRISILGDKATVEEIQRVEEETKALEKLADRQQRELRNLYRTQNKEKQDLKKVQQKELEELRTLLREECELKVQCKEEALQNNMAKLEKLIHARCLRLVARWYLQLQIFKREDRDASTIKGPLPLTMLNLPEDFTPYVAAYQ